jgi:acyl transferase domain-containing protein
VAKPLSSTYILPYIGVYVGIQQMEYIDAVAPHIAKWGPYNATGASLSVAAGRIAFTFGYKGVYICFHYKAT